MPKVIVFDMGNVIIEWNPEKLASKISGEYANEIVKYLFKSKTWIQLDAGELSLSSGLEEVLSNSPIYCHEALKKAFYHWGDYIDILSDTEMLIKKLSDAGYPLYMLSNCSVMFDTYHVKYPVFTYFKEKYVSAHHQLMKPGKDIYLDFLDCYDLKASDCLFIDDVLANVEGARSVGMQAYHFKGDTKELEEMLL